MVSLAATVTVETEELMAVFGPAEAFEGAEEGFYPGTHLACGLLREF